MTRKITTTGEADVAKCRDCDCFFNGGTSRVVRKKANRHAGYNEHRVDVFYETMVTVDCREEKQ